MRPATIMINPCDACTWYSGNYLFRKIHELVDQVNIVVPAVDRDAQRTLRKATTFKKVERVERAIPLFDHRYILIPTVCGSRKNLVGDLD